MTGITRRRVMTGAGAAVAVAGVPGAVLGKDAALLVQVARFHDLYGAWRAVWAKQCEHRARIEAMPDCPDFDPPTLSRAYLAFLKAHDAYRYYDESGRLGKQTGALANAIFEIPAETVRGAFEKLKIAHIVVGNNHQDGDEDLDAYQDWDAPWMETVIADFARLLGGMRP